ncbi:hypothetical protein BH18ACT14_BH18ACT14_04650 [soil metagenome]
MTASVILLAAPALILTGCVGGSNAPSAVEKKEAPASALAASVAQSNGTCPLTLPNEDTPPSGNAAGMNHGNDELWTAMWPHNVVIATPDYIDADGAVGMKWPWWRGVEGKLAITGGAESKGSWRSPVRGWMRKLLRSRRMCLTAMEGVASSRAGSRSPPMVAGR